MRTITPEKASATGNEIKTLIQKRISLNPRYAVAVLVRLYSFQTEDERQNGATTYKNDAGFSGQDSDILSSLAEQYLDRKSLTEKQIQFVQKGTRKYWRQVRLELKPVQNLVIRKKGERRNGQGKTKIQQPPQEYLVQRSGEGDIVITFPYDPEMITQVKWLKYRHWNPQVKAWTARLNEINIQLLIDFKRFKIEQSILDWFNERSRAPVIEPTTEIEIPGLKGKLRPFQNYGVQFLDRLNGRGLIGDEMGLGKTVEALAYLQLHPEKRPVVIVCPASLKTNWYRETVKWITDPEDEIVILSGKPKRNQVPPKAKIYIVNYDILVNKRKTDPETRKKADIPATGWADHFNLTGLVQGVKPEVIILDEAHYIKNRNALRTKAVKKLCRGIPSVIALTGTPIVNRPVEMYNTIQILDPDLFPSFFNFAMRYCGAVNNGWGWDFNGSSNVKELHDKLTARIMLRRLKKDVLKELPEKERSVVLFELTNRRNYDRAETDFIAWLRAQDPEKATAAEKAETLVRIEKLKQLAIEGKIDACIEWIENFLDAGRKLVVFTTHQNTLDRVVKHFGNQAVKLDGSTSQVKRQDAVDDFQTKDRIRLFVGNLKAAGVGLTLTAASDTCFLELGWTPGEHDQAEDRVHRIGQEADRVSAWYLLADETIEAEISELLDEKRKVIGRILDGKEADQGSLLGNLMRKYR